MTVTALPLVRRALYEDVADSLRQRIFTRALQPGDWIDEVAIAEQLGISRTPLREALKVLASEGLVTMKVRRGAYVTEVDEKDQREIYQMLSLLEADAAAHVAEHATASEQQELAAIHQRLEASTGNRDAFFRTNEEFHFRVLELADNRWRMQIVSDLRKVMKLHRHNSLLKQGRIEESLQEHRAIMQALAARDATAARQRMGEHILAGMIAAAPPAAN